MHKTGVKGLYVIKQPEALARASRSRPYYRADFQFHNERFSKTMTIPVSGDERQQAWRQMCRFVATNKGLKRTPSRWISAMPDAA